MKVLVVEDEPDMLETIMQFLEKERFLVESAVDFQSASEKLSLYDYDCVLLDISLPGGNGLKLLEQLKSEKKTAGVIMVSARNSLEDRVAGLDLGADDYLPKPFHLAELLARVRSVVRRRRFEGSDKVQLGNLRVEMQDRTVLVEETPLLLNRKELDVLLYLIANKGRLVSRNALAEHVWGDRIDEADSFEFIYSQIKNLRKKLKDANADIEIQAVYGIGYKLLAE